MIQTSNGTRFSRSRKSTRKKAIIPVIDYLYDLDLILAAFRHDYHITASELLQLKGKEFLSLLNGLNEKNLLMRVICVRGMNESELSTEYKQLKRTYQLPTVNTDINHSQALESFARAMTRKDKLWQQDT
ncbi:bacteriophage Gp15 family protein [Mycoplasma sp. CSL7475-4]|uniref:bacteriophage Gp15 family protein n=1 Tax=Mycoplasma sp. CSL7475-4 TaxID=2973942 RepID=UPI00216B0AE0|nr:bacteriophage Gp15 family protein [Mycoplasma sp. CSL7475-4]MCS4536749.1 bacteriophage Gp15 family protein [Mycoplasma sp. CSL7475-4]